MKLSTIDQIIMFHGNFNLVLELIAWFGMSVVEGLDDFTCYFTKKEKKVLNLSQQLNQSY